VASAIQGDLKGHLLTLLDALQKVQGNQNTSSSAETIHPATGQAADSAPAKTLPDVLAEAIDKALFNKTEGAIARIVLDQLASLPQNDDKQNVWQIEIPFTDGHHTDSVKLKINRESKANQASDQANWSVVLELNPSGLGTLHSRISLIGDVIDTYFWSDQQTITALVREHLDLLSSRYTQAGLTVGQLNALEDTPVNAKSSGPSLLPTLLDERI
jgi:flagellar hook-length control protein FliK